MSTEYKLYTVETDDSYTIELCVTESSAHYYIELECFDNTPIVMGSATISTEMMSPDEVLKVAAKMLYAVWCSWPDKAEAMAKRLEKDICDTFNSIQREGQ